MNQPKTLYIMCGVGFAGKSTLAKKIAEHTGATLVSQDAMYFEKEEELRLDPDSDEQWRMILTMCHGKIREELGGGNSVVFDDTSLQVSHRDELRDIARETSAETKVVFLDTPVEVQKERQARNKITGERHDVEQHHLDKAIEDLQPPTEGEHVIVVKPGYDFSEIIPQL